MTTTIPATIPADDANHADHADDARAPVSPFRPAAVSADFLPLGDERMYLPCYSNGRLWDQWGMPYFTRESIDQMVKLGIGPLEWEGDKAVARMSVHGEADQAYESVMMPDGIAAWPVGVGSWTWAPCVVVPTLDETLARMQQEVLGDIASGQTPVTVGSFSDLDDHADANCYGGFCEDDLAGALIAHFGGRDQHEGMPQGMRDYITAAQDALDAWIRAGGHRTTSPAART